MAGSYWEQQRIRISVEFTVDDVLTDPTTITLHVIDPDGNVETFTYADSQVLRSGAGRYYYDYLLDEPQTWYYIWIGTGACAAVDKQELYVEALGI